MNPNVKPVFQPIRRIPIPLEEQVNQKLEQLLNKDIIEVKQGPAAWVSPLVVVGKSNGEPRICLDLRRVNEAVLRERHPMPVVDEYLARLGTGKYWSKLDIKDAFLKVELAEESRDVTVFITNKGLFRFKRLPFCLVTAPELFQKVMDQILAGCAGTYWYLDDVIVEGNGREEHDARLRKPMIRKEMPSGPWEDIAIDFLGPLPNGETLLVVVDYYSRNVEVCEMQDITAKQTIVELSKIFSRFGVPVTIRADNGPQFNRNCEEFTTFCNEFYIRLINTIPYWPQQNDEDVRDQDKVQKEKGRVAADAKRRARPSEIDVGDRVLLKRMRKENKLSSRFAPKEFVVIRKTGADTSVRSTEDGKEYRRNVADLKRIEPDNNH
ncbi:uncharacterized protein K02A2.6-like [Wyeomyia smithii]|uniref:uncharacterized protein K02A2.6-like n=1 Tax=Wyeomyia smithii TaxID=174621 RepID=UPI0024680A25|nr:uncharacterized protein K02A2.6-like [Wyeomyia smithii]